MTATTDVNPHEKRVQRHAYAALAATTVLALVQALRSDDPAFLGIAFPTAALLGLAVLGLIVGAVGVHRRKPGVAVAAGVLLVLAILPAGSQEPRIVGYGIGLLFGVALLAFGELVHMTLRYERAHRAVEREGVPEEHINTVTDEALKTLGVRATLAAGACAVGVGLAYAFATAGPRQWREAVETTATLGVVVTSLALFGAGALFVLIRGAELKLRRSRKTPPKETASDVAE